jgi:hypothetical protein
VPKAKVIDIETRRKLRPWPSVQAEDGEVVVRIDGQSPLRIPAGIARYIGQAIATVAPEAKAQRESERRER